MKEPNAIIRLKGRYPSFRDLTSYRRTVFENMLGRTVQEFREWLDEFQHEQPTKTRHPVSDHLRFWVERDAIYFELAPMPIVIG